MQRVSLANSGVEVSEIGFGAMYLPRISEDESDKILERALELGINYFDTAAAYQDSEEKLGRIISKRERDFVVTSRSMAFKTGTDAFAEEFHRSLQRLGVDYIDYYGFHAVNQPPELEMVLGEPLDFLKEQKERGAIKHIAITGHNPKTLISALATGEFEMVMFPFNIIEQEPLDGLIAAAADAGAAKSVMKPLAGGVIESKELALRFFFSHQAGVVTPGMCSIDQLEHNCRIFDERRPLSHDEHEALVREVAELGREFCRRCSYCMPCPNGIMIPFVHMIHMKCYGKPMDDDVAYTLKLGKQLQPALEKCDGCGSCEEKCPYDIPTPQRVQELLSLLKSMDDQDR